MGTRFMTRSLYGVFSTLLRSVHATALINGHVSGRLGTVKKSPRTSRNQTGRQTNIAATAPWAVAVRSDFTKVLALDFCVFVCSSDLSIRQERQAVRMPLCAIRNMNARAIRRAAERAAHKQTEKEAKKSSNSQLCTGPRSETGECVSSLKAVKTGLTVARCCCLQTKRRLPAACRKVSSNITSRK
jgi:hypothetical protein